MKQKKLKMFWYPIQNFGDGLNPLLIERVFNCPCMWEPRNSAVLCGIGSILQGFSKKKIKRHLYRPLTPPVSVWTSGFIGETLKSESFLRRMKFYAVRGKMSQMRAEKISGRPVDCALGDGALLASLLLDKPVKKRYALGIIPHLHDLKDPAIQKMHETAPNSILIDPRQDSLFVLNQIAACDAVISTAMHGLIVADALGIPNRWLNVSNKIEGGFYKFNDYYSAFDLTDMKPLILTVADSFGVQDIQAIYDQYRVPTNKIPDMQKELIKAFPFKDGIF